MVSQQKYDSLDVERIGSETDPFRILAELYFGIGGQDIAQANFSTIPETLNPPRSCHPLQGNYHQACIENFATATYADDFSLKGPLKERLKDYFTRVTNIDDPNSLYYPYFLDKTTSDADMSRYRNEAFVKLEEFEKEMQCMVQYIDKELTASGGHHRKKISRTREFLETVSDARKAMEKTGGISEDAKKRAAETKATFFPELILELKGQAAEAIAASATESAPLAAAAEPIVEAIVTPVAATTEPAPAAEIPTATISVTSNTMVSSIVDEVTLKKWQSTVNTLRSRINKIANNITSLWNRRDRSEEYPVELDNIADTLMTKLNTIGSTLQWIRERNPAKIRIDQLEESCEYLGQVFETADLIVEQLVGKNKGDDRKHKLMNINNQYPHIANLIEFVALAEEVHKKVQEIKKQHDTQQVRS